MCHVQIYLVNEGSNLERREYSILCSFVQVVRCSGGTPVIPVPRPKSNRSRLDSTRRETSEARLIPGSKSGSVQAPTRIQPTAPNAKKAEQATQASQAILPHPHATTPHTLAAARAEVPRKKHCSARKKILSSFVCGKYYPTMA